MKKKDLEETIKEKVPPLLEETMEKSLGVSIPKLESDITDKLAKTKIDIYIPLNLSYKEAKKRFKKEFLKRELQLHLGNISDLAKSLGVDRRSVHRAIKEFDININLMRLDSKRADSKDYSLEIIDKKIRSTLDQYKDIIHPHKMEQMYREVEPLSRNIAKFLPHQDLTWKQAEREFEKQFLGNAMKECKNNISKAANLVGLRVETMHRKVKKLGLR